VSDQHFLFI